jgi:hypothetical protein
MRNERAGTTTLAIPKAQGVPQHNMPPSAEMFDGEITLARDPSTMRHHPVSGTLPPTVASESVALAPAAIAGELAAVVAAVRRITAEGGRVTCTGPASLFKRQAPELASVSRRRVEALVDAALEQELLQNSSAGLSMRPD